MLENAIAELKDLLQAVLGVLEFAHEQSVLVAVLDEGRLEKAKHLLENILLAHELLSLAVGLAELNVESVVDARLELGHEEDEIGQESAECSPLVHQQTVLEHLVGKHLGNHLYYQVKVN